jgi:hypothetical protein
LGDAGFSCGFSPSHGIPFIPVSVGDGRQKWQNITVKLGRQFNQAK